MATRSYGRPENGRGWMGVRFQAHPHDPPSEIVLHVYLLDASAPHQKEALGVLGVNLLHGAFYQTWLLDRCLSRSADASIGALRAMAREVIAEWRFAAASADFRAWLAAGAPSDDRFRDVRATAARRGR